MGGWESVGDKTQCFQLETIMVIRCYNGQWHFIILRNFSEIDFISIGNNHTKNVLDILVIMARIWALFEEIGFFLYVEALARSAARTSRARTDGSSVSSCTVAGRCTTCLVFGHWMYFYAVTLSGSDYVIFSMKSMNHIHSNDGNKNRLLLPLLCGFCARLCLCGVKFMIWTI